MITPTIGRVVWYRPASHDGDQPLCALVTYVHSDTMVNLAVFDPNGNPFAATSVPLRQDDDPAPAGSYAEWMPYQKGQAAKAEALEQKLAEKPAA